MNPAAGAEVTHHPHPARLARPDEVIQHLIDDRFIKDSLVAEVEIVVLEALELDADVARNVLKFNGSKIRQARLGANAGELGVHMLDRVIAVWVRIRKRLKLYHGQSVVYFLDAG